jgi:hypothetical protein
MITKLLSGLPFRTMDKKAFNQAMATLMTDLPAWGAEVNALASNLNSIAAGGAYAIPYKYQSGVGAPAGGLVVGNLSPLNTSTVLWIDTKDARGIAVSTLLNAMAASTSAVKGHIRLQKMSDPLVWAAFAVTAYAQDAGGLFGITSVQFLGGSSNDPFAGGEAVMLFFQRTGDKGDVGLGGALTLLSTDTIGSPIANLDRLTAFSSTYDKYTIEVEGIASSVSNKALLLNLAKAGAVDAAAVYWNPQANGATLNGGTATNSLQLTPAGDSSFNLTIEVRNVNAASVKSIGVRGTLFNASAQFVAVLAEGMYGFSSAVTGFRLSFSGANISGGIVRVYGHRNT